MPVGSINAALRCRCVVGLPTTCSGYPEIFISSERANRRPQSGGMIQVVIDRLEDAANVDNFGRCNASNTKSRSKLWNWRMQPMPLECLWIHVAQSYGYFFVCKVNCWCVFLWELVMKYGNRNQMGGSGPLLRSSGH